MTHQDASGYSGFSVQHPVSGERSSSELGRLLTEAGTERVVITGRVGDVCVEETALGAVRLGYDVVLPLRTTRMVALQPGDGDRALQQVRHAGVEVVEG